MKRPLWVGVLLTFAASTATYAENFTPKLGQGTKELGISGMVEFPDFEELNYDIDFSYGYFVKDGWELGVELGASDFGGADRIDAVAFTEFNFNRTAKVVPFVGAAIGIGSVEFGGRGIDPDTPLNDENGVIFNIEAGIKWFVREYMAISTSIDFKFSPDDVFAVDEEVADNVTSINIGMRFYF